MNLNIFSLTIHITKRKISQQQALQNEQAKKIFDENRRKATVHNPIRNY